MYSEMKGGTKGERKERKGITEIIFDEVPFSFSGIDAPLVWRYRFVGSVLGLL